MWIAGFAMTALAVTICYSWLDRPVALWVHSHLKLDYHGTFSWFSRVPDLLVPAAAVALAVLGLRAVITRALPANVQASTLVASVSVLVTEAIKDQLKFVFSRTWPTSWMGHNPSFIRDGVYGFHFMQGGANYQSFPSGHMAASCAVLAVLWIWYPRWRALYFTAALVVGLGLVAANYHFLSDVIAGAFLGVSIGWLATTIWNALVAAQVRRSK